MGHKKILFISPVGEFYGGGERSGFEFCKFLEKNKYKVITVIPKSSRTYKKTLIQASMEYRLMDCSDFESQIMLGNAAFSSIISQLMNFIKEEKIDIVITNLYAQAGPVAAALSGIPNISMDRGQAYEDSFFSDFMTEFSDLVLVNSSGLAGIYKNKYGIETPVVYSYTSKPKIGLNKKIKEQRIVCVSRVSPEKNLIEILKAVKILKNRGYNNKVLLIGPVPGKAEENYKNELKKYIKNNNLEDSVLWMGDQKHPWKLVGEKDIYVNTSIKESVGRSNIEAIKLGVPVVIVDIPGHQDIIEKLNVDNYPVGKHEILADKIQTIFDNYSPAKTNAKNIQHMAEAWINEYDCNKAILPALEKLGETSTVSPDTVLNHALKELQARINSEESLKNETRRLSKELELKNNELASYLSIKRSARILAGNIKRRIQRGLKSNNNE